MIDGKNHRTPILLPCNDTTLGCISNVSKRVRDNRALLAALWVVYPSKAPSTDPTWCDVIGFLICEDMPRYFSNTKLNWHMFSFVLGLLTLFWLRGRFHYCTAFLLSMPFFCSFRGEMSHLLSRSRNQLYQNWGSYYHRHFYLWSHHWDSEVTFTFGIAFVQYLCM